MAISKYALRVDAEGGRLVECTELDGFFVGGRTPEDDFERPDEEPGYVLSASMRGLRFVAPPDRYLDEQSAAYIPGDVTVEVLDAAGDCIGEYPVWDVRFPLPAAESGPDSAVGLTASTSSLPHAAAQPVWDAWRVAVPTERNLWSAIPAGRREGWLEAAQLRHFHRMTGRLRPVPEGDLIFEGRQVVDLASFFCAVGEAFSGPGGYFGSNFMALADCLDDADRPQGKRFRLLWHDFPVAQRSLSKALDTGDGPKSYLGMIMEVLSGNGVDVVPA
ncbi:MAG TPA: barstar family protein [Actinocrinis sp.]|nr:barstar family protein [Actinocrinis sp.]